jgi:predicted ABC-type ATPase
LPPTVYIIAGPNGAGKTTFAREFLPHYADCSNFINADLIAEGISPLSPSSAAIRAGRIVLEEIERYTVGGETFGFETTLAGRAHVKVVQQLKGRGYKLHVFFLWLPDVDLALSRIKERVSRGGHNVPEKDVRRRYERSIKNFFLLYRGYADSWSLFDNTGVPPQMIASQVQKDIIVREPTMYNHVWKLYGNL